MITLPPAPLLRLDYTGLNTLIISDTHFGPLYDQNFYKLLIELITNHDQVIINGDFWDGWYNEFDEFLNSPWNVLFPHLLEKSCVYLPGNHDPADKMYARGIGRFATQIADKVELKVGEKNFVIEHGHRQPDMEAHFKRNHKLLRAVLGKTLGIVKPTVYEWLHKIFGNKTYLPGYYTINTKHHEIANSLPDNTSYVVGHSHYGELVENYANSGHNYGGHLNYLSITPNGSMQYVSSNY